MTVYVLEFEKPLGDPENPRGQARYYTGYCNGDVETRLAEHRHGCGAAITRAANARGIAYRIVAVLPAARASGAPPEAAQGHAQAHRAPAPAAAGRGRARPERHRRVDNAGGAAQVALPPLSCCPYLFLCEHRADAGTPAGRSVSRVF
ncbi:MAG: hypothetical protein M5R40_07420 [Anaerolineae bacterium]|nr:hypothetical protein [Anaerolineae bacterium]